MPRQRLEITADEARNITLTGALVGSGKLTIGQNISMTGITEILNVTGTLKVDGGSLSAAFYGGTGANGAVSNFEITNGGIFTTTGNVGNTDGFRMVNYTGSSSSSTATNNGGTMNILTGLIRIGNGGNSSVFNQNDGVTNANGIHFNGSGATFHLRGGTLNLGASGITDTTGTLNLSGGTLGAMASWSTSHAANLTEGTTTTINTTTYDTTTADHLTTGSTITLNGQLSGTGSLKVEGVGTLVLSNANTYSGGTEIIADSTLNVTNAEALGSGTVNNSGTLTASSALTLTDTLTNNDGASVRVAGLLTATDILNSGTLEANAGLTLSGTLTNGIGGTLILGGDIIVTATGFVNNGTIDFTNLTSLKFGDGVYTNGDTFNIGTVTGIDWSTGVSLTGLTSRQNATYASGVITVSGNAANLTWISGDGIWNEVGGATWNNGSGDDVFVIYDNVTFGAAGAGSTVTINGDITAGTITLTDAYTFNVTVDSTLSGTSMVFGDDAILTKTGAGTLTLTSALSDHLLGAGKSVNIQEGSLHLDTILADGTSDLSFITAGANGTLAVKVAGDTSDSGNSDGTMTRLNLADDFAGKVEVRSGLINAVFTAQDSPALAGYVLNNGGLCYNENYTETKSVSVADNATGYIRSYNDVTVTLNSITGSANSTLTKTDRGTLILNDLTGFSGSVRVGAGNLTIQSSGTLAAISQLANGSKLSILGNGTNLIVNGGAAKDSTNFTIRELNGSTSNEIYIGEGATLNENVQYHISNSSGLLTITGGGTYEVTGISFSRNNEAGNLKIDANTTLHIKGNNEVSNWIDGSFQLSHWANRNSTINIDGKLISDAAMVNHQGSATINVNNGGTLELAKGLYVNSGRAAGNLYVQDGGTLILGDQTIDSNWLNAHLASGSTLIAKDDHTRIQNKLWIIDGATTTLKGAEAGKTIEITRTPNSPSNSTVKLENSTTLLLSSADYSEVSSKFEIATGSTLKAGNNTNANVLGSNDSQVVLATGAALQFANDLSSDTAQYGGSITGQGSVSSATAKLTLNGDNSYEGGTNVTAGTLNAGHANAFGKGAVNVSAGAKISANTVAIGNDIYLAEGAAAQAGDALNVTADMGAASITGENSSLGNNKIENATINRAGIAAGTAEIKDSKLTNASYIVNTGGATTLTNVELSLGVALNLAEGTNMVNSLTVTGTMYTDSITFTGLSYSLSNLGSNLTVEGAHILLESNGDTLNLGSLNGASITGGTDGYTYSWGLNDSGDLVVNVAATVTELTVTGVAYVGGEWTFTMTGDAYTAFTTGANAFTGNLLFNSDAMDMFMSIKEDAEGLTWMENLTISNGSTSLEISDKFGDFTINGAAYVQGHGYFVAEIPEPTTVTLSLLALAGLAARRRRKA